MTTFDRYLLSRFVSIFLGLFAASMGLFAVIDGFMNLDGFQQAVPDDRAITLLKLIGSHYLYQTSWVLDLIGPTLLTLSFVAVLALLLRHGELHPLLAAGTPTYRLALPFLLGLLVVHALLIVNREWIIPPIADKLTAKHGEDTERAQEVDPQYDRALGVFISGESLLPGEQSVEQAEFRLWAHGLVEEFVSLCASHARHFPAGAEGPGGWYLSDVSPPWSELPLTEAGRTHLIPQPNGSDVFLVSNVTFDQLSTRGANYTLLSTPDLMRRIRRPASGSRLQRAQVLHLHVRLTKPLLNIVGLFLVIPLIVRRESLSLVTNMAICMVTLALVIGVAEAGQYLGRAAVVAPEFAAWVPCLFGGSLCAWLSPLTRS